MTDRLAGKIAIVTGAGQGIGRASALRFAEEGAHVIVNDLDAPSAAEVVKRIRAAGGAALAHPADVTDPEQMEALVARASDEFGRLDIMFNNAGGATPEPTDTMPIDRYRKVIALNLDSVFFGTQCALRVMLPQGGGCILMTTSGAGIGAVLHLAAYGAAKAGVINLARSVATEYGRQGIRANVISPGPMATQAFLGWLSTVEGGKQEFEAQVPAGRLGTPEDIAQAALFLASDEASFINGITVPVDGGLSALYASPQLSSSRDAT